MSFKRSTALTLATVASTLAVSAPALAMPSHDAALATSAPVVLTSSAPSGGDEGTGTLTVLLLSAGALVAGAAAGFGTAKASAGRAPLHPR
jgi:hypothetical protein